MFLTSGKVKFTKVNKTSPSRGGSDKFAGGVVVLAGGVV